MKKRVPIICTIIFLLGIFTWSGITIEANESSIKFSNLYGERSELGDVQFNLAKDKGVRVENLTVDSNDVKKETSFFESGFNGINSSVNVLEDKKFFRGLLVIPETFYEDNEVMVDVTDQSYGVDPHLKVRIKDKKTNTYENFQVENKTNLNQDYRINGISYKDGKINILFMKNTSNETMIIFGEINIDSKELEVSEPMSLNKELDLDNSYIFNGNHFEYSDNIYFEVFEDEKNKNTILEGVLEIDLNTKEINIYKPDEKINNEIKEIYKDGDKGQSYIQDENIYFSFYDSDRSSVSILNFNFNTKKFTFYKNLIEKDRFERYGVSFSDISNILISGDKVFLNLTDFNEDNLIYYKGYISVVDINSKNPLYIGEYEDGVVNSIKVIGGK
ncbi:hypothetical protein [Clostridium sp. LIBA-8841]|uniref:hypothetical protein n=1 Tax=Clostridium sp. LIBA-8841 TaxID=2987530 RepID=UPI002AC77E10|nr:hypothetical protein [Clostridium sp. LIBA-8841]MDZ5252976.1 hypothetical protein [Clostridium sp. LIBA-8841]